MDEEAFKAEVDKALKVKLDGCDAKAKEVLAKMQIRSDSRSGL